MAQQYEYLVCQAQQGRITFVNGQWQGTVELTDIDSERVLQSCPEAWTYLADVGKKGWELVAALDHADTQGSYERLFLKRDLQP